MAQSARAMRCVRALGGLLLVTTTRRLSKWHCAPALPVPTPFIDADRADRLAQIPDFRPGMAATGLDLGAEST